MGDVLVPIGIMLLGLVGLTVYVLAIALRDATKQITSMNEKLMILLGTRESDGEGARALVAASRQPKKVIPGVAQKNDDEKPKGFKVTVGAR